MTASAAAAGPEELGNRSYSGSAAAAAAAADREDTAEPCRYCDRSGAPKISGPSRPKQLPALAAEIRDALVTSVAKTGGHLGPNLGCVELTIALHRVFDSPREPIVFDTGHQAYVHKMLTGRVEGFERLRQRGGLSGYPSRAESEHDWVENSHASTSLSYADGLAKAFAVRGD